MLPGAESRWRMREEVRKLRPGDTDEGDNFWAAGKKYAPECWRDLRKSFDQKALDAARRWDAGSARDYWTWFALQKSAENWTLAQLSALAPYLAKVGPESWFGVALNFAGMGRGGLLIDGVQKGARLLGGGKVVQGAADVFAKIWSNQYFRLGKLAVGKSLQLRGQNEIEGVGGMLNYQNIPGLQPPPPATQPMTFKPELVPHSRAFRKYGFPMPTGRADVFPQERMQVAPPLRQSFLTDYYRANPAAAARARSEARTVIDWSHKTLREPMTFEPEIVTHSPAFQRYGIPMPTRRSDVFPQERMQVAPERRQSFLRDYYNANPDAAARARSEARTVIDWAHKMLR